MNYNDQVIISIGREHGSGGRKIAQDIAKRLDIPLYDHNMLAAISRELDLDEKELAYYDEKPKTRLFTRRIDGLSGSPYDAVANLQFDFLKKKADGGESFVVVGRCSETVLADNGNLISIFVLGDMDAKLNRITKLYKIDYDEARAQIQKKDRRRKEYHNDYCVGRWGDSRNYDLCINSSKLGIDGTTDFLYAYILKRIEKE